MQRDIDYVVKEGEVIIVDEFTGRLMVGRRYNEGLHQAIEAKEGVEVARESKTLATITFQNYFRLYDKLSGMTGTALTEAEEFGTIYKLDIIEIPTNKPLARIDNPDVVYKNENGKFNAILDQIEVCHAKGQPVLVGTVSIEMSELIAKLLKKRGVPHNVLNAKHHEKEAEIVAQAGKFGSVTIATNMAGRGTDIVFGGNPEYLAKNDLRKAGLSEEAINEATGFAETDDEEIITARKMFSEKLAEHRKITSVEADKVREAGGLFIIGTERHEARRIDNQLRGRAGRQGDPGETRFYISLTDDIMRLFGSERIMGMMETLGLEEDMPIDKKMLSNAIESAQRRVESRNFQSRKSVLEYDDVMNTQRKIVYDQRRKVLDGDDITENIKTMIAETVESVVGAGFKEQVKIDSNSQLSEILKPLEALFLQKNEIQFKRVAGYSREELEEILQEKAVSAYAAREKEFGCSPGSDVPIMRELERVIMLRVVDEFWMDHIDAMEGLRDSVRLRAYAQTNPVDEYKRDGFGMFEEMISAIKEEVVRRIFTVRIKTNESLQRRGVARNLNASAPGFIPGFGPPHMAAGGRGSATPPPSGQSVRKGQKIGRNDPCPCGKSRPNGLPMKFKDCCGRGA